MFFKKMANGMDEEVEEKVFDIISKIFAVNSLHDYQKECLVNVVAGKDCFICQPTGSGKSVSYQAVPFVFELHEKLKNKNENGRGDVTESEESFSPNDCKKIVLVISPLIALMHDQVLGLKNKNINAICLQGCKDVDFEKICNGYYNIVFVSPETILQSHRTIFKNKSFNLNLVAIAVDESHCVKKWGAHCSKIEAFRKWYGRLGEIRSLTQRKVPIIALTATATTDTISYILNSLCINEAVMLCKTPERSNIKYYKVVCPVYDIGFMFKDVLEDIKKNGYFSNRVVVFCRKMKDVRNIYSHFHNVFSSDYSSFNTRPYAMFHSRTTDKIKDHVIKDFMVSNGRIRFLVATIAFGMGIDCKGLYNIVHFGPPAELDDYFQEAGRGGRDGGQVHALLLLYPKSLSSQNISKQTKQYCNNDETCRRSMLLKQFSTASQQIHPLHNCCDVCTKLCCCGENCINLVIPTLFLCMSLPYQNKTESFTCELTVEGQLILREKLVSLRNELIDSLKKTHSGTDISSGFPMGAVDEIILQASTEFSIETVETKTSIFNSMLYERIVALVCEVSNMFTTTVFALPIGSEISEISESSDTDTDSDSDIDFCVKKYHACIISDSESD